MSRNSNGTFATGNAGGGRKKGSQDRYAMYRSSCEGEMPELIKKLMIMALEGDLTAAKLILDRCWNVQSVQAVEMQMEIDELRELLSGAVSHSGGKIEGSS